MPTQHKMPPEIFLKLFNSCGCANALKTKQLNFEWNELYLPDLMQWADANSLPVRGHTLIWPGNDNNNHLPDTGEYDILTYVQNLEVDPGNQALMQELRDQIDYVLSYWASQDFGGYSLYEWDVVNEPRGNHRVQDVLSGPAEMATWFDIAEQNVPNQIDCKLMLNEFGIISAAPTGTQYPNYRDAYMNNIQAVLDNGGKLDRLGFQSRMKRGHLTTDMMYDRLEEFYTAYGLEMVGTEFEVVENSNFNFLPDEYERAEITEETMTAYFSHPGATGLHQWTYMRDALNPNAMVYYNGTIKLNGLVWFYVQHIRYHTEESLATDENGRATVRGFKGAYDVTVQYESVEEVLEIELLEDGITTTTILDISASSPPSKSPSYSPSKRPSHVPTCSLEGVGDSCETSADCCSGLCSSGKKQDRVCLVNSPTVPPAPTTNNPTRAPSPGACPICGNGDVCCAPLTCASSGKPSSRACLGSGRRLRYGA